MERLSATTSLVASQQKEWGEILTGFETGNRYAILDESGNRLYLAVEEAGSTPLRWFLKALRPFTIDVVTGDGQVVMRVRRPFRFYFHRAEVVDPQGESLGVIERRFAVLHRIYSVFDSSGKEVFQLFGPVLRPWTFQIQKDGIQHGKIVKKWSGLLKEGFTDTDNFGVMFPKEWHFNLKVLFLGAVFLVDFVHFED